MNWLDLHLTFPVFQFSCIYIQYTVWSDEMYFFDLFPTVNALMGREQAKGKELCLRHSIIFRILVLVTVLVLVS